MVDFNLSEEEKAVQQTARDFARNEMIPLAAKYDQSMEYPWEIVEKAHATGLVNMRIPERFGGLELSNFSQVLVLEELGYGCAGMTTAMTANDLALGPLVKFGTDEQIEEFATPMVESFKNMAAYCVTEPGAGSDVQGIRSTVKKDGDDYILNGEKMWITNASVAKWFYVLATLDPSAGYKAMCAFVVPANTKGIEIGKKEINVGQCCSDTRGIAFKDVRIPKRYLLGQEGTGFKIAMTAFDGSRPQVAAVAVGLSKRALDESTKYALERKTFGKLIAQHQAIQFILADMATETEASRLLTWKSAKLLDEKVRNSKYASYAKLLGGDTAVRAATNAVQVFGGYGYNTEYPVEKLYRDAKIFQIYEGTQQIQRLIIARALLEKQ